MPSVGDACQVDHVLHQLPLPSSVVGQRDRLQGSKVINHVTNDIAQAYVVVGSGDLPFEGCGEVQSAARGEHPALGQHVIEPVGTRYALAICVRLWRDHMTIT